MPKHKLSDRSVRWQQVTGNSINNLCYINSNPRIGKDLKEEYTYQYDAQFCFFQEAILEDTINKTDTNNVTVLIHLHHSLIKSQTPLNP